VGRRKVEVYMGAGRGVASSSRENSFAPIPRHREGYGPKTGQNKNKKKKNKKKEEEEKEKKKKKKTTRFDRLCGLVVRVSGYRYRGPGFDPRRYQIF